MSGSGRQGLALAALLLITLTGSEALAHTRSLSSSTWTFTATAAQIELQLSALDDTLFLDPQAQLTASIHLAPCAPQPQTFASLPATPGFKRYRWRFDCPFAPEALRVDLLFDLRKGHVHLVHLVHLPDGLQTALSESALSESALSESNRELSLRAPLGPLSFLPQGVLHILGGLDHLLFVLLLVVAATSLPQVARTITGFTFGHSITLALAVLGYTEVEPRLVELMIALSIIAVALENLHREAPERRRRYLVAAIAAPLLSMLLVPRLALLGLAIFCACTFGRPGPKAAAFGLIHGFGFAGALTELRPNGSGLAGSLLAFNLGVELGQLAVVALLLLLLRFIPKALAQRGAALLAIGMGSYWAVERALGAGPP